MIYFHKRVLLYVKTKPGIIFFFDQHYNFIRYLDLVLCKGKKKQIFSNIELVVSGVWVAENRTDYFKKELLVTLVINIMKIIIIISKFYFSDK